MAQRPSATLHFLTLALVLFILLKASAQTEQQQDREIQSHVPKGQITHGEFSDSQIFPGTTREYWVYVPAQYAADTPANLMVFMDGRNYMNPEGTFRVPVVLDNLIYQGALGPTVAVFVNPGTIKPTTAGASVRSNRSFEYDSLGDRYARFLIDEFLPTALHGLNVSIDPQHRAVAGISSGGICAFTVAWERPDQFGKVLSHIGSYTNIRGGWAYPGLIRKTRENPKAIRVYLQEGHQDLNNLHGNWPLANRDMAAALQFAGYRYRLTMTDGGHSGRWGGEQLPSALRWLWDNSAESTVIPDPSTKPQWQPHPDALVNESVPRGTIESMPPWQSTIFEGTTRRWAIYVPAQYDPQHPTALMVFQDGERMRDLNGRWRIPIVFDNLIARGDMPPTIAVFIDPGHDNTRERESNRASNRGFEYDSLGNRYVRFLLEEILPEVEKRYNISKDPNLRAIGGSSSGAICAFTAAWERTDQFQKVYSNVGSFTNLRGGNLYPSLVRKTEPKPIRIYMSDTSGDVDNAFGSWPLANQQMSSAFSYMGYDHRFDWAEGYAHNADFGSSKFPEAMKWLWRDEQHHATYDTSDDLGGDLTLLKLLVPNEGWELVATDLGFADAPCSDSDGNFYFSDMRAPAVFRVKASGGEPIKIADEACSGLEFGPSNVLYGCQGAKNRIISIAMDTGMVQVIAGDVTPNDMAITKDGFIYITETRAHQIRRIDIDSGHLQVVDEGIARPNGIALSNDGGTLAVSDSGGPSTWTFRVTSNGSLDAKMPSMPMRLAIDYSGTFAFNEAPPYQTASRGDGMAVDEAGRYYVTSDVGVQIFDPTGRPCGVLPKIHADQPLTSCTLAGPNHEYLYITHGTRIYRRKLTPTK
ncbi:MAG: SMP-30/gluconolactonase/LRE family protein [Planctomycetales bacterium]|nr:SMP-30/gluconolactonase/LRE family protein [Planctomycetales bacterium]